VSPLVLALLMLAGLLALLALRVPIAAAMFLAGALGYAGQAGLAPLLAFLNTQAFARLASHELSVIPLFILMGHIATQGGLSRALFGLAARLMTRFRGGLAMASVMACAAFGAICGSSVATAATIAQVALPELRRHGYSGRLATGTLAAGGTLGILIPPSVPLVIYAILTEQNVAKLFAAAVLPGLLALGGYLVAIALVVRWSPGQAPPRAVDEGVRAAAAAPEGASGESSARAELAALLSVLLIFALVFGGIYGGAFTPTEGAAVGVVATLATALLRRSLSLAALRDCATATAATSAMIFFLFIGADVLNSALALTQLPAQAVAAVRDWSLPPLVVVGGLLLMYVLLGAVMDELSMILLTMPVVFPMVMALDLSMPAESVALWFGVLVLMTVGFGLVAPPVGLNVCIVNSHARDVPLADTYRGALPFLLSDTLRTLLLLFVPSLSLWLVPILVN